MSHTYSGTATYHSAITIPDDGDPRNASSVNVAFEALQDDVTFLRGRSLDIGVDNYNVATGTMSLDFNATTGTGNLSLAGLGFGVQVGDFIPLAFTTTVLAFSLTSGSVRFTASLQASENGGSYADVPGAVVTLSETSDAAFGGHRPLTITGHHLQSASGSVNFRLHVICDIATTAAAQFDFPYTFHLINMRFV